jgi:hypothetical protein
VIGQDDRRATAVLTSKIQLENEFSTVSEFIFSGQSSRKVGLETKKKKIKMT